MLKLIQKIRIAIEAGCILEHMELIHKLEQAIGRLNLEEQIGEGLHEAAVKALNKEFSKPPLNVECEYVERKYK